MKKLTLALLALAMTSGLYSCGPKKPAEDKPAELAANAPVESSDMQSGDLADSDSGKAMGLETVHYAFDSSVLDSESKKTLDHNVGILKAKSTAKVQIEGHCDERGGIQYNIALGERRANAAKAYLVDKGIQSERLSIISYGKEKPIDAGHDETAWGKNRRANFRITEK